MASLKRVWWLVWLLMVPGALSAHPMDFSVADTEVGPEGRIRIVIRADLRRHLPLDGGDLALMGIVSKPSPEVLRQAYTSLTASLTSTLEIRCDGTRVPLDRLEFPPLHLLEDLDTLDERHELIFVEARAPPGSSRLDLTFPPLLSPLQLWVQLGTEAYDPVILRGGDSSLTYDIARLAPAGEGVVSADATRSPPSSSRTVPAARSRWAVAGDYVFLGFEHILPLGLDHILFVLGLFLLSPRLRPLLWQVSAFTLAHTVTLALTILGHISLSPDIVEPIIALSIAAVAIENLVVSEMTPWRPYVVFGFGLLHGMGFAGVLGELGLPQEGFVTALVSFNVGVELGQLAVIVGSFILVGWAMKRSWYRRVIVLPASLLIALTGLFWTVDRLV